MRLGLSSCCQRPGRLSDRFGCGWGALHQGGRGNAGSHRRLELYNRRDLRTHSGRALQWPVWPTAQYKVPLPQADRIMQPTALAGPADGCSRARRVLGFPLYPDYPVMRTRDTRKQCVSTGSRSHSSRTALWDRTAQHCGTRPRVARKRRMHQTTPRVKRTGGAALAIVW